MKQVIRRSVFETNSSSMHSLSLNKDDAMTNPTKIYGTFGEFGWGFEKYRNYEGRLSYLLTAIASRLDIQYGVEKEDFEKNKELFLNNKYFLWTNQTVKNFIGEEISFDWNEISESGYCPFGYIDHQSIDSHIDEDDKNIADVLFKFWSNDEDTFKENMKDFIFNNKYEIIIDNDNSPHGYIDYDN